MIISYHSDKSKNCRGYRSNIKILSTVKNVSRKFLKNKIEKTSNVSIKKKSINYRKILSF
jgi:hypothetical protein